MLKEIGPVLSSGEKVQKQRLAAILEGGPVLAKRAGRQCIQWGSFPAYTGMDDVVEIFLNAQENGVIDYKRCIYVVSYPTCHCRSCLHRVVER